MVGAFLFGFLFWGVLLLIEGAGRSESDEEEDF